MLVMDLLWTYEVETLGTEGKWSTIKADGQQKAMSINDSYTRGLILETI